MRRRGFTLGPMLAMVMVAMLLALMLAGVATFQLNAVHQSEARDQATYLAEGAISQTLSDLKQGLKAAESGGQQFGLAREHVTFSPYPERSDAVGEVSFDPTNAWGGSTNDFDGTHPVGWHGVPVPSGSVHLIARGTYGSAVRTVEAFVSIPAYAFAVAVQGNLTSSQPLDVRAEASMASLYQNSQNGTPDHTLPANVGSNGSISTTAAHSDITGDVVASIKVALATPCIVGGSVKKDTVAIPVLSVTAYNNSGLGVQHMTGTPSVNVAGNCVVNVPTYAPQSVVVNGNLQMQDALLYVDGDLRVNGGITGTGAVCVHGNVYVVGGADLTATNTVALLSTGDVTITGSGPDKYFQGLVYSEGTFTTADITVAGAMMVVPNPAETTATGTPDLNLGPNSHLVEVKSLLQPWTADAMSPGSHALAPPCGPARLRCWAACLCKYPAGWGTTGHGPCYDYRRELTLCPNDSQPLGLSPSPKPWSPNLVKADSLPDMQIEQAVLQALEHSPDAWALPYLMPSRFPPHPSDPCGALNCFLACALPASQTGDPTLIFLSYAQAINPARTNCYGWAEVVEYQGIQYDPTQNRFIQMPPPQKPVPFWLPPYNTQYHGYVVYQDHEGSLTVNPATLDQALATVPPLPGQPGPLTSQTLLNLLSLAQTTYMNTANALLAQYPASHPFYVNTFLGDNTPLQITSWQVR